MMTELVAQRKVLAIATLRLWVRVTLPIEKYRHYDSNFHTNVIFAIVIWLKSSSWTPNRWDKAKIMKMKSQIFTQ